MLSQYEKLQQRKAILEQNFKDFLAEKDLQKGSWDRIGWIYAISTERMKDKAVKIGHTSKCPIQRARQIGFKFYEGYDSKLIFLPTVEDYQAEWCAQYMAHKAEDRANNIMSERGKSTLFGFPMRSGGTEIYGMNWRQAIGILSMARNEITRRRFQKKPA